ncbi:MAG: ZIP family metal transporter [bacterium]
MVNLDYNQLFLVLIYALVSDLATGLGVIPFIFYKNIKDDMFGILNALSGGMMVGASFIVIADEALKYSIILTVLGLFLGAYFVNYTSKYFDEKELSFENLKGKQAKIAFLTFIVLFFHSFPEGVAIGMAFNSSELKFGIIMAIAIALHNIPEGLVITLQMYPRGVSLLKCFWYSVLSSLPQPLAAIPAYLIGHYIKFTIPLGLGFAAGSMIYLTLAEILPESFERTNKNSVSWAFLVGVFIMIIITKSL